MKSISMLAFATAGLSALSCGPSIASKVRSDAPTMGGTSGGTCGDEPAPWVIDLPEDKANQLETEMKKGGLVLVRYDCKEFKIVRGCDVQLGGDYGYSGLSFKSKHKELEDKDSLALNLSGGPAFAAKMSAEFERGSIFRIDYASVGRLTTTTEIVSPAMLRGQKCSEATHFVAAMDLGAYILVSGAAADIAASALILGQGGKAGTTSKVKNQSMGGDAEACKKATVDDQSPPAGCRTPLLVQLFPIEKASRGGAPSPPPPSARPPGLRSIVCPPGKVPDELGSCRSKDTVASYVCAPGELAECRTQCDKGNPQSCAILGHMFEKGEGTKADMRAAEAAYKAACAKKDANGCTGLGYVYSKSDDPKLKEESTKIFTEACNEGNGRACSGLGHQALVRRDLDGALRQFDRGCRLGYTRACFYAGRSLARSGRDDTAYINFRRACSGGDNRGCLAAGSYLIGGVGPIKNPEEGAKLQERGLAALGTDCKKDVNDSCEVLGDFYAGRYGKGTPKGELAAEHYEKACGGGQGDACWDVALIYDTGLGGAKKDPAKATKYFGIACDKGNNNACAKVGKKAPSGPSAPPPPPSVRKAYCNDQGKPARPLRPGERCP